jgi:hypothetical protein
MWFACSMHADQAGPLHTVPGPTCVLSPRPLASSQGCSMPFCRNTRSVGVGGWGGGRRRQRIHSMSADDCKRHISAAAQCCTGWLGCLDVHALNCISKSKPTCTQLQSLQLHPVTAQCSSRQGGSCGAVPLRLSCGVLATMSSSTSLRVATRMGPGGPAMASPRRTTTCAPAHERIMCMFRVCTEKLEAAAAAAGGLDGAPGRCVGSAAKRWQHQRRHARAPCMQVRTAQCREHHPGVMCMYTAASGVNVQGCAGMCRLLCRDLRLCTCVPKPQQPSTSLAYISAWSHIGQCLANTTTTDDCNRLHVSVTVRLAGDRGNWHHNCTHNCRSSTVPAVP